MLLHWHCSIAWEAGSVIQVGVLGFADEVVATEEEVEILVEPDVRVDAGLDLVDGGAAEVEAGGDGASGASSRIMLMKSMGDSKAMVKPRPIASSLLMLVALTPASVTLQKAFSTPINTVTNSADGTPLGSAGRAFEIQAPQAFKVDFHLVAVRN
jgi:hypothetical protein